VVSLRVFPAQNIPLFDVGVIIPRMQETSRFQMDPQSPLDTEETEQVQVFSDKILELLVEQAEKKGPMDAVAVAFLERAMDFTHFAYGREGAKKLTLDMLEDIQRRYDFERN